MEKDPESWDSYSQAISLVMLGSSPPLFWFHIFLPSPLPPPSPTTTTTTKKNRLSTFPSRVISATVKIWSYYHKLETSVPQPQFTTICAKIKINGFEKRIKTERSRDFPGAPNAREHGSIPGQELGFHMLNSSIITTTKRQKGRKEEVTKWDKGKKRMGGEWKERKV